MSTYKLVLPTFQQYDNELEDLRSKVLSMGGVVEDHLVKVIATLSTTQLSVEYVAESDHVVSLEIEIDQICTEILFVELQPLRYDSLSYL